jgi:hypothetical protein
MSRTPSHKGGNAALTSSGLNGEIAGTIPPIANRLLPISKPRVLLLYDLPDFRMVRLRQSKQAPPRWMSQVRRGTPTTVEKGRFGEDGKT